jgi:hypothetical protein
MASSFSPETPILYLNLRPHTREIDVSEYILWPAWMYRVVAPRARRRELDLFQKAILKLCQAGVTTEGDIGEKLRIHADLVSFILDKLHKNNMIGYDKIPTSAGIEALTDQEFVEDDMVVGYVFQDPWKGTLWSRFVENIDYAEIEVRDDNRRQLRFGTAGNPRFRRVHMEFPGNDIVDASPPQSDDILRAASYQNRAIGRAEKLPEVDDDWSEDVEIRRTRLSRVSLVDEIPQPIFLTTFMYSAMESEEWDDWYVCDPFGLGISFPLQREIDKRVGQSKGLAQSLNRVLGYSSTAEDSKEDYAKRILEFRNKANSKLRTEHDLDISQLSYGEDLSNVGASYEEVISLGDRCPLRKLIDVLNHARRCLEELLFQMGQEHGIKCAWDWVSIKNSPIYDGDILKEKYERAAQDVGFNTPIPEPLQKTKANKVKSVALFDGRELHSLIIANLLIAEHDNEHLLRKVAQATPQMLETMSQIIRETSQSGAHGAVKPDRRLVDNTVQTIHQIVGCIESNRLD